MDRRGLSYSLEREAAVRAASPPAQKENAIRVGPEVGCRNVSVEVLVQDSEKGRKIDLQPATQDLATLAKAYVQVVLPRTISLVWPRRVLPLDSVGNGRSPTLTPAQDYVKEDEFKSPPNG